MDVDYTKNIEFFVQDGQHVEVSRFLKNAVTPIFAMGKTREYTSKLTRESPKIFSAKVRMDQMFTVTKRKAYTLQSWFGEVGGLDRMFTKVARWLVGGIASRYWINAILGSLYMMKQNIHDDKKAA